MATLLFIHWALSPLILRMSKCLLLAVFSKADGGLDFSQGLLFADPYLEDGRPPVFRSQPLAQILQRVCESQMNQARHPHHACILQVRTWMPRAGVWLPHQQAAPSQLRRKQAAEHEAGALLCHPGRVDLKGEQCLKDKIINLLSYKWLAKGVSMPELLCQCQNAVSSLPSENTVRRAGGRSFSTWNNMLMLICVCVCNNICIYLMQALAV